MDLHPKLLVGQVVRLEPLSLEHVPGLTTAGQDESIWQYMLYGVVNTDEKMRAWVKRRLDAQTAGTDLPFAVIHIQTGQVAGATRYMESRSADRGLEIGGTWYGVAFQRTAVNTECKYLLFKHAFETLGCIRVQLKTDLRNVRSQHAIERLGAVKEGILRNHMILPDGTVRHSVYYSIIESEWPAIKARLETMLEQRA